MRLLKKLSKILKQFGNIKPSPTAKHFTNTAHDSDTKKETSINSSFDSGYLFDGYEFIATLQLRVPLRVLELDGSVRKYGPQPEEPEEQWRGIWIHKIKTWRDLGIDMDEFETSSASDIGYVNRDEYLVFLKEIRKVVETNESIKQRIDELLSILRKEEYTEFVRRLEGMNQIIETFFPYILDSIPELSRTVRLELRKAKITTVRQLRDKTDKDLLSFKGVGLASLKKIREFCQSYTGDETATRIDTVKR